MKVGTDIGQLCMNCMNSEAIAGECATCGFCENMYESVPHHLPLRTILNGKYLIGRVLGEGGFGITYLGWDLNLDFKLAIKEYYPTGFANRNSASSTTVTASTGHGVEFYQKGRNKFVNEAKTLAKFYSLPGIVSVRDFFLENGTAYIVMEFVDGTTLKEYLHQNGEKLPVDKVMEMMKPLMYSLLEVHQARIIHRDISPDNIMVTKEGSLKLLDFGAAREFLESGQSLSVFLKPGYAPPEQYFSRGEQGPWTDVYALCATIYKAITGVVPSEAPERLQKDLLPMPSALGVFLDRELENALMKGLALTREDRWQDIGQLVNALLPETSQSGRPNQQEQSIFNQNSAAENEATAPNTAPKRHLGWMRSFVVRLSQIPMRTRIIVSGTCASVFVLILVGSLMKNTVNSPAPTLASLPQSSSVSASTPKPSSSLLSESSTAPENFEVLATPEEQVPVLKSPGNPEEVVVWQDEALEALIREGLGRRTGDITAGDLAKIESLEIVSSTGSFLYEVRINMEKLDLSGSSLNVKSHIFALDDLQYCINLSRLEILAKEVTDLTPLSGLTSLQELHVDAWKLINITPLSKLTNLKDLHVYGDFSDISPVSNLSNLRRLSVIGENWSNLDPIRSLTELEYLDISRSQVKVLSPLQPLTKMQRLNITEAQVEDLSPLAGLKMLTHLSANSNSIKDLSPLSSCVSLESLWMGDNDISDLSPLKDLKQLTSMYIADNPITDWTPVAHVETVYGRPEDWEKENTSPIIQNTSDGLKVILP